MVTMNASGEEKQIRSTSLRTGHLERYLVTESLQHYYLYFEQKMVALTPVLIFEAYD